MLIYCLVRIYLEQGKKVFSTHLFVPLADKEKWVPSLWIK